LSGALLDHLWQSTLFGVGIWLVAAAMRANSAAVRHWLWLLASLKFLVPFAALHALGGAVASAVTPAGDPRPEYLVALQAVQPLMSPAATLEPARATPNAGGSLLAALWLAGATWLGLRWFLGWRMALHLSHMGRPAANAVARIRVIEEDIEPSVARVIDPVVLLPAALCARLPAPQLDSLLEHEREHIVRHDNAKAHLHRLVETLFWFHPWVWFIGRRLVEERERACDEAVLARGHDAGEYAGGILAVCRHCTSRAPYVMAAASGDLASRVRHILADATPVSVGFLKAFALTAGALALAAVPLIAGALDRTAHRSALAAANSRLLFDAQVTVRLAAGSDSSMEIAGREIVIRNSSLRELIALAYEVDSSQVRSRGGWLDSPRYDIRAVSRGEVREPEDFEPGALRAMVNKLLAERFDFEVHVNQQCQDPCGPRALAMLRGAH